MESTDTALHDQLAMIGSDNLHIAARTNTPTKNKEFITNLELFLFF